MKQLRNEDGMILITVILLMAIVALLGVIAINTSTVDIQISGNLRRVAAAFGGAEAGVDLSVPVIERTLAAGALDPTSLGSGNTINGDGDLASEIIGGLDNNGDSVSSANPDITLASLGGVEVKVDIDRMYSYNLPGGAMEFASGYEGVGAAAAGGGIGVLYRITSQGNK
jgi:Tfp pilus assembly protein PilX